VLLLIFNFDIMIRVTFIIIIMIFSGTVYSAESASWWKKKKETKPDSIQVNIEGKGYLFNLDFINGKGHNNPSFAIWLEDMKGNFIQELFVTQSIATGVFRYGDSSSGQWEAGERRYYAALPYYFHKRSKRNNNADVPDIKNPVLDAYSGATPSKDFNLVTRSDNKDLKIFRILIEINQTWDFNNFWHNAKFPDDTDYRTSAQPSLVYSVTVNTKDLMDKYYFNPIGHGHYSGKDGRLYTDLSTFTTALNIFERIELLIQTEE
jgi:hypothetical protein